MIRNDYVSTREIGFRNSAGIAYLIIPGNVDRNQYIKDCFRKGTVTIAFENGGIFENAIVSKHVFNFLDFPLIEEELGTLLFWVNVPKINAVIIVAALNKNNELINLSENQFSIAKKTGDNYIEISGDTDDSKLIINVEGKDSNGKLNISVTNTNNNAEFNLLVKGNINIHSIGNVNLNVTRSFVATIKDLSIDKKETILKYEKGVGLTYKDEFDNEIYGNATRIQIKPKQKLDIGEGREPILLGNTTEQLLREFITLVSTATTTTAIGVMPLLNATQIAQLNTKLETLLSKYSFTD